MGVEAYGIYIYVITWCTILIIPSKLGLDSATLRFVSAYNALKRWSSLRGFLIRSNQLTLITSLVVSCLLSIILWIVRDRLDADLTRAFWIGCFVIPVTALITLNLATLRSLFHASLAQFPIAVINPLLIGLIIAMLFFGFGKKVDGSAAMHVYLLSSFLVLFLTILLLKKKIPKSVFETISEYRGSEWMVVSLPLMFTSAMGVILNSADTVLVGSILGTSKAGIYSVAARLAMLILFLLNAINVISGPMISALYAKKDFKELQRLINLIALVMIIYTIPLTLILIFAGKWILAIYGHEFTTAKNALIILSVAQLINALAGPVGYLLTMTGHQKQAAWVLGISVLLNILLNIVLIPYFGINGAAIGTAITTITWNLVLAYLVWKYLKINMFALISSFPKFSGIIKG